MSLRRLLPAVLGGYLLLLSLAQAQTKREPAAAEKPAAKESRPAQGRTAAKPQASCKLRLAWWSAPEEFPELAMMMDKDRVPVSPDVMSLSYVIDYHGEPNAVIVRKTLTPEVDKAGKAVYAWVPYCAIPIGEQDVDLGVLLFPDEKRAIAQTKILDFSPEGFPYGTVQLMNFTTSRIAASINGVSFTANSRSSARYPKAFEKTSTCRFFMAAAEPNGEQKLLRSTTVIFRPTSRYLIFATENLAATEDARYRTSVIVDNLVVRPTVKAEPTPEPKTKAKAKPASEAVGGAR
jgi:hypothetical protein